LTLYPSISILCQICGKDRITDEKDKDRRGAALLGELLLQLGQRESLRRKLGDLEDRLGPAALGRVLDELERIVQNLGNKGKISVGSPEKSVDQAVEKEPEVPPAPTPKPPAPEPTPIPAPVLKDPFADLLANLNLPTVDPLEGKKPISLSPPPETPKKEKESRAPQKPMVESPAPVLPEKKPERGEVPAKKVSAPEPSPKPVLPEPPRKEPTPVAPPEVKRATPVVPPVVLKTEPPKEKPAEVPPVQVEAKKKVDVSAYLPKSIPRSRYPLEPEDVLYLHAVAQIPVDEKPALEPFILEEKGIESKELVFALDRGGLRFYLSRLTGKTTNVSKTGMLLLNRKESIQLRGTHSAILNDLRVYGLLLPFEFGTVAMGAENLYARIDEHVYDLRDALEEIVATKWWEVCVYGLDMKMIQIVAPDAPASLRGERDRRGTDRSAAGGSRIDIKTLERVLNRQKAIAEEIHHQLDSLAARSDVDMMVNLSSGSSDDWKPILRASYEVGSPDIYRFNHAINDLQYVYLKYQLMFVLTGDREDFSFQQS
jgi:hypothetical protein